MAAVDDDEVAALVDAALGRARRGGAKAKQAARKAAAAAPPTVAPPMAAPGAPAVAVGAVGEAAGGGGARAIDGSSGSSNSSSAAERWRERQREKAKQRRRERKGGVAGCPSLAAAAAAAAAAGAGSDGSDGSDSDGSDGGGVVATPPATANGWDAEYDGVFARFEAAAARETRLVIGSSGEGGDGGVGGGGGGEVDELGAAVDAAGGDDDEWAALARQSDAQVAAAAAARAATLAEAAAAAGEAAGDGLSKRARRKALLGSVAALKQAVAHPEVVEAHDVTSPDPHLLIALKSTRNTVPVPRHWCSKSKYLQRKVGLEKPPFALPAFIEATGITKLRNSDAEAGADATLKTKQRERYLPKMGRIEIAYDVLHDAFFVHQTKPKLSRFGELYYQGKEFEARYDKYKPGLLSTKLREALGMPPGDAVPPPWLTRMQQYGPPPSYPFLRVPGVNAPLPPGAEYGTQAGGWGRPPTDEYGRPLYGDVFGVASADAAGDDAASSGVRGGRWGEARAAGAAALPTASSAAAATAAGDATAGTGAGGGGGDVSDAAAVSLVEAPPLPPVAANAAGAAAAAAATAAAAISAAPVVDGTSSVVSNMSGLETPAQIDLRKGPRRAGVAAGIETPSDAPLPGVSAPPPALYTVLQEQRTALTGGLLGTTHTYVLPPAGSAAPPTAAAPAAAAAAAAAAPPPLPSHASAATVVALAPEELERIDGATLARKYEQEVAAAAAARVGGADDVSDLLEEQERKRKRREAGLAAGAGAGGSGPKAKRAANNFKF